MSSQGTSRFEDPEYLPNVTMKPESPSQQEKLVCEACWVGIFNTEEIQRFWNRTSQTFHYSISLQAVVRGAEGCCNWCSFLKGVLPSPEELLWPTNWSLTQELFIHLQEASLTEGSTPVGLNQCELDFGIDGTGLFDWHAEVDFIVDEFNPIAQTITARPIQQDVNSSGAYEQIRNWLAECAKHPDCVWRKDSAFPSRLIDVGPAEGPPKPRLSSGKYWRGQYLALSYCWGLNQEYVLNPQNIRDLEHELDLTKLPRTIQDAVQVTRTLGFRYLWVDSLCIMQETPEGKINHDMIAELAVMDSIYERARATIVAACASSCNDGFLQPRHQHGKQLFRLPCRLNSSETCTVQMKEHLQYSDLCEPINHRAWTLQEQLLSPRLLIYASHTLQWQCQTLTCNLGGAYHALTLSATPRLPSKTSSSFEPAPVARLTWIRDVDDAVRYSIFQHWLRVVTSYSRRRMSVPSDKLTALASLTKYFASHLGPGFYAGLWGKYFFQQLSWQCPDSRGFFTRTAVYRAPSWSWASLDGPLHFRTYQNSDETYRCDVADCRIIPKVASLPYGEVTSGELTLRAVIRYAWLDAATSELKWKEGIATTSTAPGLNLPLAYCDTEEDKHDRSVACLAIYRIGKEGSRVGGLMLESLAHGSFKRIGRFAASEADFSHYHPSYVTIL